MTPRGVRIALSTLHLKFTPAPTVSMDPISSYYIEQEEQRLQRTIAPVAAYPQFTITP
jgi:hypothetical protein